LGGADECDQSFVLAPPAPGSSIVGMLGRRESQPDVDVRNDETCGDGFGELPMGTR